MPELLDPDFARILGPGFPSLDQRLNAAARDPITQRYFNEVSDSAESDRPAREAQLVTYLAAAHLFFPEESRAVFRDILARIDSLSCVKGEVVEKEDG